MIIEVCACERERFWRGKYISTKHSRAEEKRKKVSFVVDCWLLSYIAFLLTILWNALHLLPMPRRKKRRSTPQILIYFNTAISTFFRCVMEDTELEWRAARKTRGWSKERRKNQKNEIIFNFATHIIINFLIAFFLHSFSLSLLISRRLWSFHFTYPSYMYMIPLFQINRAHTTRGSKNRFCSASGIWRWSKNSLR